MDNQKMDKKKKTILIISIISLTLLLVIGGTLAFFGWFGQDSSVSLLVSSGTGSCTMKEDNQISLIPTSAKENGRIIKLSANQQMATKAYITWDLVVNSINGLKHESFKYELVNSTTGVSYGTGDFANITNEEGSNTITFMNTNEKLDYNTDYEFTLYLWIDGVEFTNPTTMANQDFDFDINCSITGTDDPKITYTEIAVTNANYSMMVNDISNLIIPATFRLDEEYTVSPELSYPAGWYKVIGIDDYAFEMISSIESVTISEGITYIGHGAFIGYCGTTVTLPKSVTSIDDSAFSSAYELTDVYYGGTEAEWNAIQIGEDNEYLTGARIHYNGETSEPEITYIDFTVTADNRSMIGYTDTTTDLVIPATFRSTMAYDSDGDGDEEPAGTWYKVTAIGDNALKYESNLNSVVIPDTVTEIGEAAFECSNLEGGITLSNNLVSIGYRAFAETRIPSISFPNTLTSIGDNAFSDSGLYCDLVLPDNVTVGYSAFSDTGIRSVTAGNNNTFKENVFMACSSLTSITLPVDITFVDVTFVGNYDVDVYYDGSMEQWQAIAGTSQGYDVYFTVHCSDGDLVMSY